MVSAQLNMEAYTTTIHVLIGWVVYTNRLIALSFACEKCLVRRFVADR